MVAALRHCTAISSASSASSRCSNSLFVNQEEYPIGDLEAVLLVDLEGCVALLEETDDLPCRSDTGVDVGF
jgi:hypothetical protein